MIGIINYGAGNIKSVKNALNFIDEKFKEIKTTDDFKDCDKVILPGVGAFKDAMSNLKSKNLDEALKEFIKSGNYFLGICLGLQLLFETSEEFGNSKGLEILKGKIVKFNTKLKIPHMGWNSIKFVKDSPLILGLNKFEYFYFVHSFHLICDYEIKLGVSEYDYEFASVIQKDNIFAIQAHPEKSHKSGLKLLQNFARL